MLWIVGGLLAIILKNGITININRTYRDDTPVIEPKYASQQDIENLLAEEFAQAEDSKTKKLYEDLAPKQFVDALNEIIGEDILDD